MPQPGQIIPDYLHPSVQTIINDNTEFVEETSQPDLGIRSLFVFTSGKGRDGVLLEMANRTQFIEEFGKPDYSKYGQPIYMPYAFLSSGQTRAYCMRVMPDDASYANSVIVAKVKVDTISGSTPVKRLLIRFQVSNIGNITDKEELLPLAEAMTDTDPDSDGFMTYPLFILNSHGRGVYGDAFRYRISTAVQADKENEYKNYRLEVYELENSLKRKEVFEGTLSPDSVQGTTSLFFEDVVNDSENGSNKINITVIVDSFKAIFDMYKEEINPTTELTFETFDFLYGKDKDGQPIQGIAYDTEDPDYVSLDTVSGIPLAGGSDGSFAYEEANLAIREEAIIEAYQKAFRGEYDRAILSKRRTPCQFIFDAGYPEEVKSELITLMTKRYDAYGFIDAGILNSVTDAIAWGESMKNVGDRLFSKEFQHYKTRDPFTGKIIPVTITYFYANALPMHFITNGNHIPFTGENYALLTGHIKNSLAPIVDADDRDVKEQLYLLRLNYFQAIAENTFVRGTQTTSQNVWSDLSEENNMHVLLELKRMIENMVSSLAYNFAEAEDRIRFTETAQRLISPYIGTKIREGTVTFQMSPWEEQRSILHCYLSVVFRTLGKRGIVEIDINPRV